MRYTVADARGLRALVYIGLIAWAFNGVSGQTVYPPISGSGAADSSPSGSSAIPTAPSSGSGDSTASPFAVTNSMNALDDTRQLGIGDVLAFRVVEDNSRLQSLIVTDSGEIEIPYIGRLYAKGKTCKQLASEVKQELEREYYQQATVIIGLDWAGTRMRRDNDSFVGDKVHVWGEVRKEGAVAIPPDGSLTLTEAILAAGGFTPFADRSEVTVLRNTGDTGATFAEPAPKEKVGFFKRIFGGGSKRKTEAPSSTQEFRVNVKRIMERGDLANNISLKPNDVVIIDEKMINF
ncbi:MAG: polysaccharide biosynthesis/export family protein [Verrucomicrobiota bacterium]